MAQTVIFFLTEYELTKNTLEIIKKYDEPIVVPLTFKAVNILEKNKIKFSLDEDTLSPHDYQLIDTTSYEIGRTWWNQNDLKSIFDYRGINIALLPETELISSLLKFIHRLYLIEFFLSKFKPEIVYFSNSQKSISKIPEIFQKKYNFLIKNIESISSEKNFRFENFSIGYDFLGKTLEFSLSRKNFFKIKKYYQLFWNTLFKLSTFTKKSKNGKKILLFDFNLITHKSTIEHLSNSEFDLLFYNSRRPLIWNKNSLDSAKKLNFRKIQFENNIEKIHPDLDKIMQNFKDFDKKNDFLSKIFSINGVSFWKIFKNDFLEFCSNRFSETLFFIDSFNRLLDQENIELLLTLDDSQQIERTAILICKQRKIPTIFSLTTGLNIFHDDKRKWEIFMINKIFADKFAISGTLAKEICLEHNIEQDKLVITGNPRYDEIFNQKFSSNENTILLCLSGLPGVAWSTFLSLSFISNYEKYIKAVFLALSKINRNVIVKIHPSTDTTILDINKLVGEFLPKAKIYKNANVFELISKSDIVISPPSSVINESLILDKPVLMLKYVENDSGIPYEKFNALLSSNSPNDIEKKIKQILFDDNTRHQLLIGRKKFLKYAFEHHGKSSHEITNLIRKMIR